MEGSLGGFKVGVGGGSFEDFDLEDFFGGAASMVGVGGSLVIFDFEDGFFGVGASGDDVVVFDLEAGAGVAFGGAAFAGAF